MGQNTGKILLVDGYSILNRAFYGLPDLTNAEGKHTGAVYGFLKILLKIMDEETPSHLAVAFDVHAPTFRHAMYEAYKGTRKPMPEELREQVPLLKEVLDAMGIARAEQAGLEADDILGTIAKRAQAAGMDAAILSGDRDLLQVADERITIVLPRTKGGKTEEVRFDPVKVKEEFGVTPLQFIELKALQGDSSDNIPGVPKVGEKTARELMETYGSVSGIYGHLEEITKKAVRESLRENKALCELSKDLATIKVDSDIAFAFDDARLPGEGGTIFTRDAYELFVRLGFKQLLGRFNAAATAAGTGGSTDAPSGEEEVTYAVVETKEQAKELLVALLECERVGFAFVYGDTDDTEENVQMSLFDTDRNDGAKNDEERLRGLAVCGDAGAVYYMPEGIDLVLKELSEKEGPVLSCFDVKNAYRFFAPREAELTNGDAGMKGIFDILIASYLLNPLKSDYAPEDIAQEHLDWIMDRPSGHSGDDRKRHGEEASGSGQNGTLSDEEKRACDMALLSYLAEPVLREKLSSTGQLELFEKIEMPLAYVLYDMERLGIKAKRDALKAYGERLAGRIGELENAIHAAAGEDFNINSPKQLGEILFEKMGLPGGKKTKTGYSTAADVLEKLAPEVPFVRDVLEYRGLAKLKSTYADALADYIAEDGRIHTVFHQCVTATGRLSSSDPNLQNIPMRTDLGREIRKVFVPEDGYVFVDADYSQIELRILAHMSDDAGLIEAYHSDKDIHAITASKVFHVPFEEVTPLMRRNAKAVNFGIVYGISAFGLGNDLSISREEAKQYMEQYFETYPGVKTYQERAVADAKEHGYSETLYKRRRPVPELKSSNFMQRSFGERVAMNAPIQGTAADIMKIAMLRVWRRLRDEGLKARMILQIHDELLIEAPLDEQARVEALLAEEMRQSAQLKVPLEVEAHAGADWYECK